MRSSFERDDRPLFVPLPPQRTSAAGSRPDFYSRNSRSPAPLAQASRRSARPSSLQWLWPIPKPVQWTSLGFLGGAVFWHFVGFWSFMSHIVFTAPESSRSAAIAPGAGLATPRDRGAAIETGSLQRLEKLTSPKFEPSCTAVARDPVTGDARQAPCQRLKRSMKLNTVSTRQDVLPAGNSKQIEAPALALDPSLPLNWPPSGRTP